MYPSRDPARICHTSNTAFTGSVEITFPTNTASAVGGNAHPSGTVVTAEGNVVVVVVVVVVTNGAMHPTTGIVVPEAPVAGGHNTGTLVGVVVVVVPETAVGEKAMNAAASNGTTNTERRIPDTLLTRNTLKWAPERRY